ncbi:MAG: ABC transporter ATP-binding protein, partial [Saprospiraceae bacterium]|nr:ABC transporter ATP-binding protein [Saprospiraceae bacterium]
MSEEFPYFTSLHVNDCFTYRDFDIPIGQGEGKPFRHLILTGRNGSGKTTILRGINDWMALSRNNGVPSYSPTPISPMLSERKTVPLEKKIVEPTLVNNSIWALRSQDLYAFFASRRQT